MIPIKSFFSLPKNKNSFNRKREREKETEQEVVWSVKNMTWKAYTHISSAHSGIIIVIIPAPLSIPI